MESLRQTFGNDFSSSAFKVVDGEQRIVGKFGEISIVGKKYDIYFGFNDQRELSSRKLTAIEKKLPIEAPLQRLTGEGYTQVTLPEAVRLIAPLVGIKKKRRVSDKTRERLAEQLSKH